MIDDPTPRADGSSSIKYTHDCLAKGPLLVPDHRTQQEVFWYPLELKFRGPGRFSRQTDHPEGQ